MPVRSARRASRQGMPRRPVAAGQSPDRDRSRPGVGPMSPIALVATGRPVRPGRRVVRIGLVATDGSCCLQPGTLSRAICYCPPPARAASTYSDGSPGRSSCPGASIMVATTAKKLHLSRAGTANFDGKTCERAALAVNWPTCLAPDIQSQFDLTNSRPGCIFMHRQVRGEYLYLPRSARLRAVNQSSIFPALMARPSRAVTLGAN
jgi:hypothetical protein